MSGNSNELFKFSWTIENMVVWDYRRIIKSPTFVVEKLGTAAFHLELEEKMEKKGFCGLCLKRARYDEAPEQVRFNFILVTPDGKYRFEQSDVTFTKGFSMGVPNFVENAKTFSVGDWSLLCGDLQVECIIFEAGGGLEKEQNATDANYDMPEDSENACKGLKQLRIRTGLRSEEVSLRWEINGFSAVTLGDKETTTILCDNKHFPRFLATLFISSPAVGVEHVEISIKNLRELESKPALVACKVSFDDIHGIRVVKKDNFVFASNENALWRFPALADRRQLVHEKNGFLRKDSLSLLLQFLVCSQDEYREPARSVYEHTSSLKQSPELPRWRENYLKMFKEQENCDVSFETSTKKIRAHKFILTANSSVFKTMFEKETPEKQTNTIQVGDVSADTLERFLECLYNDRLEGEVDAQLAVQLYFAADKYRVVALRDQCSRFLRRNLHVGNFCEVLSLADRHEDGDLLNSLRAFFLMWEGQVLASDEWKRFRVDRTQLANEFLEFLCNN